MNSDSLIAIFRELTELRYNIQETKEELNTHLIKLNRLEKNVDNIYEAFEEIENLDRIKLQKNK